ncbi:hypothetical protein B0H11DRAFT_2327388 [Mycena galericulata]|nr:hypothetical protein B0H11DRAFT_2327388 [Mycena galericulata]
MDHRNLQYVSLYNAHTTLQEQSRTVKGAYEDLKIRWDTLNSAYTALVTTVSDRLSTPAATAADSAPDLVSNTSSRDHLRILERSDYENITYWTESEYLKEESRRKKAKGKVTMADAQSLRGSKRLAEDDENVMYWFIEDKDGNVVSGSRIKAARAQARKIWNYLQSKNRLPPHWNDADSVVRSYFASEMCLHFPELQLCELDYKAHRIATIIYPGWHKKMKQEPKLEPDILEAEASGVVAGTKRVASEQPSDEPAAKKKGKSKCKSSSDTSARARSGGEASPPSEPPIPSAAAPPANNDGPNVETTTGPIDLERSHF